MPRELKTEWCRDCRDEIVGVDPVGYYTGDNKPRRADFILWGKLLSPEALGPKCYDHASKHLGDAAMSRIDTYAVYDLRPVNEAVDDA